MRVCWVGWNGPAMNEFSEGPLRLFPELQYYLIGNMYPENSRTHLYYGTRKREILVTGSNLEEVFKNLDTFDLMFYDTYAHSIGHRPEIYSHLPGSCPELGRAPGGSECLTNWPQWESLKHPFKILVDTESVSGHTEYFKRLAAKFDGVLTCNKEMPGYYSPTTGVSELLDIGLGRYRGIDVLYSGDNLDKSYRRELASVVASNDRMWNHVIINHRQADLSAWEELLGISRIFLSTQSCANGEKTPMCTKHKDLKAMLHGCLAVREEFPQADEILVPGEEIVTFKEPGELPGIFEDMLTDPATRQTIVKRACSRIMSEWTYRKVYTRLLQHYGVI